jgi:hypothetical protein
MNINTRLLCLILFLVFFVGCNTKENRPTEKNNPASSDSSKITTIEKNQNPYSPVDISPMDMSYYPVDYPKLKMTKAISTAPLARVIYSRPHLQGRTLFHDVLKYGEPWRLGANESTELDFYNDVTILDKTVKAGRYVMYCIPEPDKWTIVINSNIDSWGLQPDSTKDIDRFIIPVNQTTNRLEYYTMIFEKNNNGADLVMAWDNLEARLPVVFSNRK